MLSFQLGELLGGELVERFWRDEFLEDLFILIRDEERLKLELRRDSGTLAELTSNGVHKVLYEFPLSGSSMDKA